MRCKTIFSKVALIVADIFLLVMTFSITQERAMHNFISDTHVTEVVNTSPDSSMIFMGTSDTTLLTIVLVHMVIMLIAVIRSYKSKHNPAHDKAGAYD